MGVLQFTPSQLPQHYQEDVNALNTPLFSYNGALFLFISDGVGSPASGGGTSNLFVYKSLDGGGTWSNITPGAPVKTEGLDGLIFIRSGNVVYLPIGSGSQWQMFGFDLMAQAWITDGPLCNALPSLAASQSVVRTNGEIVCLFGTTNHPYLAVYNPGAAAWSLQPALQAALTNAEVLGGVLDSIGHIHWFLVTWSGASIGVGTATVQHIVVFADNSVSAAALVYTFAVHPDVPGGSGDQVGLPVAYFDVTPALHKLALPIAVPSAPTKNTSLIVLIATESDTPVWSTVTVPTGENFAAVTLGNTGVSDNSPAASILPVQFSGQTQLFIFWTSNGSFFAIGSNPWNSFFRYITYSDTVFSAVTTLLTETNNKITPGPVYPLLLSNDGMTAKLGGMFITIDQSVFFSLLTKYSALGNWSMAITATGPVSSSGTVQVIGGGMGCVPQCVDPYQARFIDPARSEAIARLIARGALALAGRRRA